MWGRANASAMAAQAKAIATPRATPLPAPIPAPPHPGYPVLEQTPAILCVIVNVAVLPGIGTLIAGSMGGKSFIVRGVLQLLLTPLLIGYVWSVMSAIRIMGNANWARRRQRAGRPVPVA